MFINHIIKCEAKDCKCETYFSVLIERMKNEIDEVEVPEELDRDEDSGVGEPSIATMGDGTNYDPGASMGNGTPSDNIYSDNHSSNIPSYLRP